MIFSKNFLQERGVWAFDFASETIDIVEKRKMEYINRVFHWADHLSDTEREWADFMLRSF